MTEDEQRILDLFELFEEEHSATFEEAHEWILSNFGSHERMNAMMFLQGQLDFPDWLALLGEVWPVCDNIGAYKDDLVEIFKDFVDNPLTVIPELMSPHERAAFDALPDHITIYRGCGPHNQGGLSWSLSRDIAVRFPFSIRYWTDQPMLLTATISKNRVAALKLERNEQEVIVIDLPASCWTAEFITEPPPSQPDHS